VEDRLIESGSFSCTFGKKDFGKFLDQIAYYQKHGRKIGGIMNVSEFRNLKIDPASIYLNIDIAEHKKAYRVSMRAFWMTHPQETESGSIITTNLAGIYLSSFFSLAYLEKSVVPNRSEKITGLWKIYSLPKRNAYGFFKISKKEGSKYHGDLFVPNHKTIRKRGIIVNLNGNKVYWTYFDNKETKDYKVLGVLHDDGARMAVEYSTIPSSGMNYWELERIE